MVEDVEKLTKTMGHLRTVTIVHSFLLICTISISIITSSIRKANGNTTTASTTLTINTAEDVIPAKIKERGYFTASEYAIWTHQSIDTVYKKAASGEIAGKRQKNGRWMIPLKNKQL